MVHGASSYQTDTQNSLWFVISMRTKRRIKHWFSVNGKDWCFLNISIVNTCFGTIKFEYIKINMYKIKMGIVIHSKPPEVYLSSNALKFSNFSNILFVCEKYYMCYNPMCKIENRKTWLNQNIFKNFIAMKFYYLVLFGSFYLIVKMQYRRTISS